MKDISEHTKGLLKFITCGSVDDGKSTLIGHMLYDAKLLYTDQEQALELDSRMIGSRGGMIDYSLLLDGLMAEREQGITIDVAYRYFTTNNRSFIVADTPGHEEYTRNMAVGASFADLAVILVDATSGILVQTKRHARICRLMGIRFFVFALNKMDLVHYDKAVFERLSKDIHILAVELELDNIIIIPVSATEGDNVNVRSENMNWWNGTTLLEYLESVDIHAEVEQGFIMPVQRVCRPDRSFRGFCGQIESGSVLVGTRIVVYPSKEKAGVKSILFADKSVDEASVGMPVTIELDREIDASRGCVFVKDTEPVVSSMFTASILWMDDEKLVEGKSFILKLATSKLPATVMKIKYRINVNTGEHLPAGNLFRNEIAVCDIAMSYKIVFDSFDRHRVLGEFILIDRVSHMTAACGVIKHSLRRSDNLTWQHMDIDRDIRSAKMNQKPITVWFTGLSGAGKSTLANEIEKRLSIRGNYTMLLDGDNVRMGLNRNLGFDEDDRIENIRRVAEVSKLMNDAGLIVLTSFISPYRSDRKNASEIIGKDSFIEVYVSTPLEECEKRDVKGLYKKAREGNIPNFTGINSPYEAPMNPDIEIDTSRCKPEEAAEYVMKELERYL